jgi:hypothetical protein
LVLRKGQTFGSLQQAPQFTQWPWRCFETGSMQVKVLLIFAAQVFLCLSAMQSNLSKSTLIVCISYKGMAGPGQWPM